MDNDAPVAGVCGFAVGMAIGLLIGCMFGDRMMKQEALDSGNAYYNQTSGDFEWGPQLVVPEQE